MPLHDGREGRGVEVEEIRVATDGGAGRAHVRKPGQVPAFERFEVGAGIERKQDDFVAEVMAQVKSFDPSDSDK